MTITQDTYQTEAGRWCIERKDGRGNVLWGFGDTPEEAQGKIDEQLDFKPWMNTIKPKGAF